ncbi:armadillo-type protein [Phellopilus nigrolimitatus]|nr:armadillo-type protein [Phellopilus nigrolimitatus]
MLNKQPPNTVVEPQPGHFSSRSDSPSKLRTRLIRCGHGWLAPVFLGVGGREEGLSRAAVTSLLLWLCPLSPSTPINRFTHVPASSIPASSVFATADGNDELTAHNWLNALSGPYDSSKAPVRTRKRGADNHNPECGWYRVQERVERTPEPKEQVKQDVLKALASPSQKAGGVAAQIVAAIAAVELPNSHWAEIIEILLRFMDGPDNVSLKIVTLQAIGYICETIKLEILSMRSNKILTAVIHGARKEEPSVDVQLAAINALYNSLEFIRDNFAREGERNYIMQFVCEVTRNPYPRKSARLSVLSETAKYGESPETESKNFAKIALPEIIPALLGLLTWQDEDVEDEWNVSMVVATCLALLAQTVADAIATVMTFGSILYGPDPTAHTPFVTQALPILVDMTRDENLLIKDTVAWTLGRICDLHVAAFKPDEHLQPLISALVNALKGKPRIVANCCWALMNLRDQLGSFYKEEGATSKSSTLAPPYEDIVIALLRVTDGTDNKSNFRMYRFKVPILILIARPALPELTSLVGVESRSRVFEQSASI